MKIKNILLVTALASVTAFAEEEKAADAEAVESLVPSAQSKPSVFKTLPLCRLVEGEVEVCPVGATEWTEAEEGHFYPLGTSYRTGKKAKLVLSFGVDSSVVLDESSEIATRAQALGVSSRTIVLKGGVVTLKLADNLPEGAFFVSAAGFTVQNPAGESRFVYENKGDGEQATVRCVTGSLALSGRHFDIPVMRSANEVVIRTSHDSLSTFLYGTSGDYIVRLDQGVRIKEEIGDDGKPVRSEGKASLDWCLSPATKVIINRSVPAIGERMSVHTMAFDAAGERKSECCFCEGRAEVNSGELVVKEMMSGEELAKRAAEATETTAADAAESSETAGAEQTTSNED